MKDPERIELVAQLNDECGESPIWEPRERAVYWCDTHRNFIHRHDPAAKKTETFAVDRKVHALGMAGRGRWILVTPDAVVLWKKGDASVSVLATPEAGKQDMMFNDGTVDPAGRYVVGSFNAKVLDAADGNLWSIGAGGKTTKLDAGLVLPNGIAFSPDSRTLYVSEMFKYRILAYDYDPKSGTAGNRRVFVDVPKEAGMPDGLVADTEGGLWCAHWLGWRITRYTPAGKIDTVLEMPFATAACAGFGGHGMNDLYIASATAGLSPEDLSRSRDAGGLFRIPTRHTGIPEREFKG
jgi:sugar lactone lactonase YvrE